MPRPSTPASACCNYIKSKVTDRDRRRQRPKRRSASATCAVDRNRTSTARAARAERRLRMALARRRYPVYLATTDVISSTDGRTNERFQTSIWAYFRPRSAHSLTDRQRRMISHSHSRLTGPVVCVVYRESWLTS